jgi:hypothetical protein
MPENAEATLKLIAARLRLRERKLEAELTPDDMPDQWEDEKIAGRIDGGTVKAIKEILRDTGWWTAP